MDFYSRAYPRDVVSGPGSKCTECPLESARNTVGIDNVFGSRCEFHRGCHADRMSGIGSTRADRRAALVCLRCGAPVERKIDGTLHAYCREHRLELGRAAKASRAKRNLVMQNGGKRPQSFGPTIIELRIITEH